jgi:hypothetical protein
MPDEVKPTVEKVVETKETTKASTDVAAAAVISPAPATVADDGARKVLALAVIVQFLALVAYWIYLGKPIDNIQMVLGAEISFVSMVLNYYFGSSSGSTAKSALLEKGK